MLTNWVKSLGLTRDSLVWFWGRVVGAAVALLALPVPVLESYVSPKWRGWLIGVAVVVLWFSGKFDSSPLGPGEKK